MLRNRFRAPRTGRERDEQVRKRHREQWEQQKQEQAQQRARAHAAYSAEAFANSRFYRATQVMDTVYNYVFMAIGFFVIVSPIVGTYMLPEKEKIDYNYFSLIVPIIVGLVFVLGIWYFVFRLGGEEEI